METYSRENASAFPDLALIEQRVDVLTVSRVDVAVAQELARIRMPQRLRAGTKVAITAGSRGIANLATILASVAHECRSLGAYPFVIPAMGSHGGANAEGQRLVLQGLGVTEESVGCPIISSMEVVQIGETPEGIPVFIDQAAASADGIVVVNRIKEHTEYHGDMGSGLMKMLVIGLGKHKGALTAHSHAVQLGYRTVITSVARTVLQTAPILFGLAVLENAHSETARIVAVQPAELEEVEKALFAQAKQLALKLPVADVDILVIDEIGKEISGTGMDTNVTGRCDILGEPRLESPRVKRIVVRDLTEETHGNAVGIGFADFITRRAADKLDAQSTYVNAITGMAPEEGRIPIIAETDREALEWAFLTLGAVEPVQARMIRIKNTACLERVYISTAVLPEIRNHPNLRVLGDPQPIAFDNSGTLRGGFPE